MHKSNPDDLLSRDQIERETGGGITRRWLEMAAFRGDGPPYIKVSRRCIRYRRGDFEAWLARRTVNPTVAVTEHLIAKPLPPAEPVKELRAARPTRRAS